MPFPSVFWHTNSSGPTTDTQDERQRLLQQENDVFAGDWGASSQTNFASGTTPGGGFTSSGNNAASSSQGGARYRDDPLPPQYTPGPMDGYQASPMFDGQIPNVEIGSPTRRSRKLPVVSQGCWFIFAFMLGGLIAWVAQDMRAMSVLNPSAIEKRRLGWDRDYTKHLTQVSAMQNITADWAHQIEQHAAALEAMRQERAEWDKERAHQIEQRAAALEAIRQERAEWDKERAHQIEQHAAALEAMRQEHAAALEALRQVHAKERAHQIKEHAAALEALRRERAEWDKERAQWQAERREHERLQEEQMELDLERQRRELEKEKDDERKKKAGLGWQDPQPDEHCLRFGTRRYTAKLENLPEGYNRMKACQETQAWINGRWVTPAQCDDGGAWNGVHGTWIVDWEEGPCHSYFQDFNDKGCTAEGSGKRRIESKLQNIQSGDDGLKMCASTPADFHGLHFDAPHSCEYWTLYGIWGLWFVDDGACA